MTDYELKPCPFCGDYPDVDDRLLGSPSYIHFFAITCKNCGFTFEKKSEVTKDYIIEKWNRRYYESDLPIVMVEDGSVDLEEVENLGLRPLLYRKGYALPIIINKRGKTEK